MKALIQRMVCAAAIWPAGLHAQTGFSNPYQIITNRNMFGLRTPPSARSGVPSNSPPKMDIRLIGLMEDTVCRKALFAVYQLDNPNQYFTAKQGEKNGYLEVKLVNFQGKSVSVALKNPETEQPVPGGEIMLTLEKRNGDVKSTPGLPHRW